MLIFDEVQCGVGRTGRLFAHEWAGVTPDIMAVAKALGNGFPIGACLAREEVAAAMVPGSHGTTFGGNPLASAVGNAVLDVVLGDGFLDKVQEMGTLLTERLTALAGNKSVYTGVRGRGLMLGLECVTPNMELFAALRENKLLALPADGNVLRMLPPSPSARPRSTRPATRWSGPWARWLRDRTAPLPRLRRDRRRHAARDHRPRTHAQGGGTAPRRSRARRLPRSSRARRRGRGSPSRSPWTSSAARPSP